MMSMRNFVIAGIIIALVVGVTAVFMASGDPDGLESTAFVVQGEKSLTGDSPEEGDAEAIGVSDFEYDAPMPDYALGDTKAGEIIAVVAGTLIALVLVFGVATVAKRVKG
jgi:cobalt/nickel transport protein